MIEGLGVPCKISLRWMSLNSTDDDTSLVQVMAWCCQETSHYLSSKQAITWAKVDPDLYNHIIISRPGAARSQGISKHDIDLVAMEIDTLDMLS